VRKSKAEWVTVQTGQSVNGDIEVFGDLTAGDEVIRIASDAIHSGDPIRVQNQATPTK
jgi:membrane fusion protein (multidrug efflux system)